MQHSRRERINHQISPSKEVIRIANVARPVLEGAALDATLPLPQC